MSFPAGTSPWSSYHCSVISGRVSPLPWPRVIFLSLPMVVPSWCGSEERSNLLALALRLSRSATFRVLNLMISSKSFTTMWRVFMASISFLRRSRVLTSPLRAFPSFRSSHGEDESWGQLDQPLLAHRCGLLGSGDGKVSERDQGPWRLAF